MNDEITDLIIRKMGSHSSRNEIIIAICEKSGLDWTDAEKLIQQVEEEHHGKIATRQSPVLIFISILTIIGGAGLLIYGIMFFLGFYQAETGQRVLLLGAGYLRILSMVAGLGMLGGGLYGLWNTFSSLGW